MNRGKPGTLVVIRGVSGSGKTSVALALRDRLAPAVRLSVDDMRYLVEPRQLEPRQLRAAKRSAAWSAAEYARIGYNAVIESVFEDPVILDEVSRIAESAGARVEVFTLLASLDLLMERNEARRPYLQQSSERLEQLWQLMRVSAHGHQVPVDGRTIEEVADEILWTLEHDPPPTATSDAPVSLLFARHGEHQVRAESYTDGSEPLTGFGEAQARALGATLRDYSATEVVSSAFLRARRTAEIATDNAWNVRVEPALNERIAEPFAGWPLDRLERTLGSAAVQTLRAEPDTFTAKGVETLHEAQRRVVNAVADILRGSAGRAAIIAHGGPHSWLVCDLLGIPVEGCRQFSLGYAATSEFTFDGVRLASVVALNRTTL